MQIDWWTLALQTVNFLVVVWLLGRFLYRPIRRVIEAREAADRKAAEAAATSLEAAEAARRDYEAKRAALDAAERRREAELHAEMEKERAAMIEAAQGRADALIADARAKIEREHAEALDKLSARIASLAEDLAAKALAGGAGDALEQASAYLDALSGKELDEMRHDLAGSGEPVVLVSAAALPEAERRRWQDALATRLGEGLQFDFQADPALLGGVELRFPHAVLGFSVAERLRRAAAEMRG